MSDGFKPAISKTYQVFPDIPGPLEPLMELADNFWWMWHPDAVELFRRLDRKLWDAVNHNPRKFLGAIPQSRLAEAAERLAAAGVVLWRRRRRRYSSRRSPSARGQNLRRHPAFLAI